VKELIEKLVGALPFFGRRLVALLPAPKSAVLALDLESDSALEEAFTFLAVSFGIAFLAQIPFFFDKENKELLFGILAVQSALAFALNVLLAVLAWKVVGGKLKWRKVVAATCYLSGVSTLLFLFFSLVGAGAFKVLDGVGYQQVMSGNVADAAGMMASGGFRIFAFCIGFGLVATYVWIFVVWGAYRELMQVSKGRSAVALILFVLFSPVLFLVQMAMSATVAQSGGPAMPDDLVGEWQLVQQSDSGGVHSARSMLYTFSPPRWKMMRAGEYFLTDIHGSANGKCLISTMKQEFGQVSVQGSTMDLMPARRTETKKDQCAGVTVEAATDLSKTEYHYKINQEASGWTLCLNDRFGQTCLTPKKQ
jgi:hypothetical protein